MSMLFNSFTSGCFGGLDVHVGTPGVGLPPAFVPRPERPPQPAPSEVWALVEPDSDDDNEEADEWDDFEPGATGWDWIDDADLFDDLFDDAEPLEEVDWADRHRDDDEDL
jgi:hypothetical protein